MIHFLNKIDLRNLAGEVKDAQDLLNRSRRRTGQTVFLSHSHKDVDFLPLVIHILNNHGATVYVDVQDDSLPVEPSAETAEILRRNIRESRKFMVLVSGASKSSNWIPWELGIGDGDKTPRNVAIIPVNDTTNELAWAEREYIGLYDRVVWGNFPGKDSEWLVYDLHRNSATKLREWLAR